MRVQDIGVSTAIMLALLVLGCWWYSASGHPPGPFGIFTWAIFLVGAVLAFSIGGSILALPFLWLTREKDFREGKLSAAAHFFYVDGGEKGPYEMARMVVVPSLSTIDVTFREWLGTPAHLKAVRAAVEPAVERVKREQPPAQWVE